MEASRAAMREVYGLDINDIRWIMKKQRKIAGLTMHLPTRSFPIDE
jgi:hypothetical protein